MAFKIHQPFIYGILLFLVLFFGGARAMSASLHSASGTAEKARLTLTREANRIIFSQDRKVIYKVYPESETDFFAKAIPLTAIFSKGKTDRAVRMTIRADKEESEWRQIPSPQEKR